MLAGEQASGLRGPADHRPERQDRRVAALPEHRGLAELVDDLAVAHLALGRVQRLVLEEQHRVRVPDRGGEQADTSRGLDGATTLSPGTAIAQFSTDCECCAPNRTPAPLAHRITSGNDTCPSDMYRLLAISLATRSQHTAKKSLNMISATGRRPVIAAPMAAPRIACSLIGVSRTRCGPNSSSRPTVALNTPPAAATSSPRNTTRSSRRISWAIPLATASR